jgi:hypothetical protein
MRSALRFGRPRLSTSVEIVLAANAVCRGLDVAGFRVRANFPSQGKPTKAKVAAWLFAPRGWLSLAFQARKSQGKPIKAKKSQGCAGCAGAGRAKRGACPSDALRMSVG